MTQRFGVLAVLALSMLVAASPALAAKPRAADRALDRALERVVNIEEGPPGAIALVHRGGVTRVHRAGVANIETDRPWRPIDHMRLASTAKAFNGAVA
ncbi:MAG: serine hydrolase, partial [Thermoleophilia bacterium]